MPRISFFYGISVYMFYREHGPPHFHAIYAEHEATVSVADAQVVQGSLPPRARSMVTQWATMHRPELQRNWELAEAGQPLQQIAPLD